MPTINQLPSIDEVSGGNQIPTYYSGGGDARKMSVSLLQDYLQDNLTIPDNASEVTYNPAGTSAVARTVESKLRDVVSVKDFGAVGNGVADDTAAIQAAISFAASGAVVPAYGAKSVYFPAGTYLVSNGAFTYGSSSTGIKFFGDGPTSTTIKLSTSGTTQVYFYKNTGAQSYRNTFDGLRFLGANIEYCNAFYLDDTSGWEKQFKIFNCIFEQINTVLTCRGTTNADECTFVACEWRPVNTLLDVSNSQSMLHNFISCRGTIKKDIWLLGSAGGGEFHYIGGSIIHSPDSANYYWINATAGPATGVQTGSFSFSNLRAELRGQYSKLVNWPASDSINRSRQVRIIFDTVNLASAIQGSGTTRANSVVVGEGKIVTFRSCVLPQSATGTADDYEYVITADSSAAPGLSNHGSIVFEGCSVQPNLSDKITITNLYGKAEATNCVSNQSSAVTDADRRAIDFQKGAANPSVGDTVFNKKTAFLKRNIWPYSNGAGGFLNEYTCTFPAGAIITRCVVSKPATGTGSATVQYHIGLNDKSVSYVTTDAAAQNAAHFKGADVVIAPLASDTTLRLWMSESTPNTAIGQHAGGYAFVEYI